MKEPERQFHLAELRETRYAVKMKLGGDYDWAYRPEMLRVYGPVVPADQIAVLIKKQSVEEVCDQADEAIRQLLYRAHTGDERAANLLISRIGSAIVSLDRLVKAQPQMMQAVAEQRPRWPVMLSLNPKDAKYATEWLAELKLGSKTATPTFLDQRTNPHTFWARLAQRAYEVCDFNRQFVPMLLACAAGARIESKLAKYWQKTVSATYYCLPNTREAIVLLDWQSWCSLLRPEIDEQSFIAWWNAVSRCVLEYWRNNPREYRKALDVIANKDETESRRRNLAMSQLRQAFKSLTGLRRKSP